MENNYVILMQNWVSVADDINQLSVAALILPILFLRKILAVPEDESLHGHINKWLYLSWFSLFLTIGLCLVYKSVATTLIGQELGRGPGLLSSVNPAYVFNGLSFFFCLGIGSSFLGYFTAINKTKNE